MLKRFGAGGDGNATVHCGAVAMLGALGPAAEGADILEAVPTERWTG